MNCNKENCVAYQEEFERILGEMKTGMCSAALCGSISHNFIVQMLPHHRAAIEMSENILKYTENEELTEIAKNIITEQTKSIEDMKAILSTCSSRKNSSCAVEEYERKICSIMKNMFRDMGCAYVGSNTDCDFIRQMIPHHKGAIQMSKTACSYPICSELKPILEAIISSQEKGVCQMQALKARLGCK